MPSSRRRCARSPSSGVVALDEVFRGGDRSDRSTLGETLPDSTAGPMDTFEVKETKEALIQAVSQMAEREKTVLTLYYYEGLTLAEIGDILGVTESRVCQIHTKAVLQLRAKLADRPEGTGRRGRPSPVPKAAAGDVSRDLGLEAGRHQRPPAEPSEPGPEAAPSGAPGPRRTSMGRAPSTGGAYKRDLSRTRPRPRSPLSQGCSGRGTTTVTRSTQHGRRHDEAIAGRGRPLRAPDPPLEPQDAPVHPRASATGST